MSYNDLAPFEQHLLIKQQEDIINSEEKKIFVSAGPGSGKTFTICKKIVRELNLIPEYKGIIACSFTKESSKSILDEVLTQSVKLNITNSFIGTIDSFVLNEIVQPFKNRYYFVCEPTNYHQINHLAVVYPKDIAKVSKLTSVLDDAEKWRETPEVLYYVKYWYQQFTEFGRYELSFPLYIIASDIISKLSGAKEYLKSKYSSLYIDEAQDLNVFQHYFINCFAKECDLSVYMIGDGYQSIYGFRGSKPHIFNDLPNKGYYQYSITVSVRCHHSILALAYSLFDEKRKFDIEEIRFYTEKIYDNTEKIKKIPTPFLVLVERKNSGKELLKLYQDSEIDIIYTETLPYDENIVLKKYKDLYMDIIEETLKFYYNCDNPIGKYIYSTSDFSNNLERLGLEIRKQKGAVFFKNGGEQYTEYLRRLLLILNLDVPLELTNEIDKLLEIDYHINHYFRRDFDRRIMTIHSSKGLEAKCVLLVLENEDFNYMREETKRKYFVAFTRAKEYLIINYQKRAVSSINQSFIQSRISTLQNKKLV